MIPRIPMRDTRLSAEAKAIYAYLCSFAGNGDEAYPSAEIMCKELGMAKNRFFKHRKQLEECGYISMRRPRQGRKYDSTVYTLNGDPEQVVRERLQNEDIQNEDIQNESLKMDVSKWTSQNEDIQNNDTTNNRYTNISLTNNSQTNNSLTSIPPIAPQGGQGMLVEESQPVKAEPVRKPKKTRTKKGHAVNEQGRAIPDKNFRPDDFEQWWKAYPGMEDRDGAVGAWEKAIQENRLPELPVLIKALEWQVPLRNWRPRLKGDPNPNYTPWATTYLNRNQWREEEPATYTPQAMPANGYRFQPTGKLQGMDLHNANMEAAKVALAMRAQARAEGRPTSPYAMEANNER